MRILSRPFDIAADGIGQRNTHWFSGQKFLQSCFKIIYGHFTSVKRIIDPSTGVNERKVVIEDEKMGGS